MRTSKELYTDERIIYRPEFSTCPHCEGPLRMYNYLVWDKTVQTLEAVMSIASRPGHCADPTCAGYTMRLLSAEGQQIALPGSTYGYDVLARIGWLRQQGRATYGEIEADLSSQVQISASHVRYLYTQVYLPFLACYQRQQWDKLEEAVQQYRGLILAIDGLAPEGGEPQLWCIRELLTGLTLRSGWLPQQDQATFKAFLKPVLDLPGPILAVVSDKQRGLVPAVGEVLPHTRHQFCQSHYLKNLAEPLAKEDEAFKVELRKAIRKEVGALIRAEKTEQNSDGDGLTVTGVLPTSVPTGHDPTTQEEAQESSEGEDILLHLTRHSRYLLTLKGRPPFRLAGIEMYDRFQQVATLTKDFLDHRYEPALATIHQGVQRVLSRFDNPYQDLKQGAEWLHTINAILAPHSTKTTGQHVAQTLQTYLDNLLKRTDLSPPLETFRNHLHKVSQSYWPGLFHCYDLGDLPRTNNSLESHFRDIQRQLLRTTGQKGQTRRALQRTGAWELLTRPRSQAHAEAILPEMPRRELRREQHRFNQHQARFQLHTRSTKRANAQLHKLRQRWLALPPIAATG